MNIGSTSKFLTADLQKVANQKEADLIRFATLKQNISPADDINVTDIKISMANQISSLNSVNQSLTQSAASITVINSDVDAIKAHYENILKTVEQSTSQIPTSTRQSLQQNISDQLNMADMLARTANFNGQNTLDGSYSIQMQVNSEGSYKVSVPSLVSTKASMQEYDKSYIAKNLYNQLAGLAQSANVSGKALHTIQLALDKLNATNADGTLNLEGSLNLARFADVFDGGIILINTGNANSSIVGQSGMNGGLLAPMPAGVDPRTVADNTASIAQLLARASVESKDLGDAGEATFTSNINNTIAYITDVVNYLTGISATGFTDTISVEENVQSDQGILYNQMLGQLGNIVASSGSAAVDGFVSVFMGKATAGIGSAPTAPTTAPAYVTNAAGAGGLIDDITALKNSLDNIASVDPIAAKMAKSIQDSLGPSPTGSLTAAIAAAGAANGWTSGALSSTYNILNNTIAYTLYSTNGAANDYAAAFSDTSINTAVTTPTAAPAYISLDATGSTLGKALTQLVTDLTTGANASDGYATLLAAQITSSMSAGGALFNAVAAAKANSTSWNSTTQATLVAALNNAVNAPMFQFNESLSQFTAVQSASAAVQTWLNAFNDGAGFSGTTTAPSYLDSANTTEASFFQDTATLIGNISALSPDLANSLGVSIAPGGKLYNLANAAYVDFNNETLQNLRNEMMLEVLGVQAQPIGTPLADTLTSFSSLISAFDSFNSQSTANLFQNWQANFAAITGIVGNGSMNTPGSLTTALLANGSALGTSGSIYNNIVGSNFNISLNDSFGFGYKLNTAQNNYGLFYSTIEVSTPGQASLSRPVVANFINYMTNISTSLFGQANNAAALIDSNNAIIAAYQDTIDNIDAIDMATGMQNLVVDDQYISTTLYSFGAQSELINKLAQQLAQ